MRIAFHKYHALGNDFVVIDQAKLNPRVFGKLARAICDRHRGVGADGLLICLVAGKIPQMRIINADGSEVETSGNGLRILAAHLTRTKKVRAPRFLIETMKSVSEVRIIRSSGNTATVAAALQPADFRTASLPMKIGTPHFVGRPLRTEAGDLIATAVSVGNPHCVFFVDNYDFDWQSYGRAVETDSRFPKRVNVEFARVRSRRRVEVRLWERGVGETDSSGTGAAAVVAAGIIMGLLDRRVKVESSAGALDISIPTLDAPIQVTGPVTYIASGEFEYSTS